MSDSAGSLELLQQVLSSKSKWAADTVLAFLRDTQIPLRLSSLSQEGFPQITSLWFRFRKGQFMCCTQQQSVVCRQIRRNPHVGFEVAVNETPYHGISGQGDARVLESDATELLTQLVDHYLEGRDEALKEWLLSRIATEVIIEVTPRRLTSWDFRGRMTSPVGPS